MTILATGDIRKMDAVATDKTVHYTLPIGGKKLDMNALIGKNIELAFNDAIFCTHCSTKTDKSHRQGYCATHAYSLAETDDCRISPEKCHYDQGTCRDSAWGEANCLVPHYVYLSFTGKRKVGITRHVSDGISSRWIDQGATHAVGLIVTKNRILSGLVETLFKQAMSDRTNWRLMLSDVKDDEGMNASIDMLKERFKDDIQSLQQEHGINAVQWLDNPTVFDINYPVVRYPEKIKSINLDKTPNYSGKLVGIKGQYLIFEDNHVINLRKYTGYDISISQLSED